MLELEHTIGLLNTGNRFIEANTIETTVEEIKSKHIIPVFAKSNEPLISTTDFIDVVSEVTHELFNKEIISKPIVRVSHPIKGRIPEAKNKAAKDLEEYEKTLYYERMAFMIEIPTIYETIDDSPLQLTVGGVKAYNLDNYNSSRKDQHFKLFIGFKNTVCTNLCVSTDGFKADLTVKTIGELKMQVKSLFEAYDTYNHLRQIQKLTEYEFTEEAFTYFVGRIKLFNYLSEEKKRLIPDLRLTDSQLNSFVERYYSDTNFSGEASGSISFWKVYNNITGAVKSSYIDNYLEKVANASKFMHMLNLSKVGIPTPHSWYLRQ